MIIARFCDIIGLAKCHFSFFCARAGPLALPFLRACCHNTFRNASQLYSMAFYILEGCLYLLERGTLLRRSYVALTLCSAGGVSNPPSLAAAAAHNRQHSQGLDYISRRRYTLALTALHCVL